MKKKSKFNYEEKYVFYKNGNKIESFCLRRIFEYEFGDLVDFLQDPQMGYYSPMPFIVSWWKLTLTYNKLNWVRLNYEIKLYVSFLSDTLLSDFFLYVGLDSCVPFFNCF